MTFTTLRAVSGRIHRRKTTGNIPKTLIFGPIVVLTLLSGCSAESTDPELRQAARAMHQMTTRSSLNRSCFYVAYPNGSSADFVDYLFSSLGTAEWPPGDGKTPPGEELSADEAMMQEAMAFEAEQAKAAGRAVLPGTVTISRLERRDSGAKELVLSPGDAKGVVLARGYMPDETEPAFESEWTLAKASPGPSVEQLCHSNIQMGAGARP